MSNISLFHGDCLDEMDNLIDDNITVDLILTDPPYGTIKGLSIDGWKNSSTEWDDVIPLEPMFEYFINIKY